MAEEPRIPSAICLPSASLGVLRLRARLLKTVRRFFDEQGFWEVETPLVSRETIVDAWLEPLVTSWHPSGGSAQDGGERLFLQTSPEAGMKRLLVAGADAIYQITRAFRDGECGERHNPEFTIVEWYRTGVTYREQMDFVERMVRRVFAEVAATGASVPQPRAAPFEKLSYDEAFQRHAGTRVLDLPTAELAMMARERGVAVPETLDADDRDGWLNLLLAELVEPHLGREHPTFVFDFPASQAALAKVRDESPPVAERFELYIHGVEVCNGYEELTDADELQRRTAEQAALRKAAGRRKLTPPKRLLAAMRAGLPPCSGVALGFDRLVMIALDRQRLADVMAFPIDRA